MADLKEGQPKITVGILDRRTDITGRLHGEFYSDASGPISGLFSAKAHDGEIQMTFESRRKKIHSQPIRLLGRGGSAFSLSDVTIGNRFHWERNEEQLFHGDLILRVRRGKTICAINEILLEDYLQSVISSEMNGNAPAAFLKTHAILSRSWLLAALRRRKRTAETPPPARIATPEGEEVVRWYDREDHDLFDVCADDHCQRYQGLNKIVSEQATKAVRETEGIVITYGDRICDARYSKACGGITEEFETAWDNQAIPYLTSIPDAPVLHPPITTEGEVNQWILSNPEAYCNTRDEDLLKTILPDVDRETTRFFRWRVEYSREELEEILRDKSGFDFGKLEEIVPLRRGPSGRIFQLRIAGSKETRIVGKELEIRRWLSRTHLYSSAFIVGTKRYPSGDVKRFILDGAGWGHGVGLCQIGAAVMATRGFSAEQILNHYFRGASLEKIY
jgi:stage II sporulation protein D